MSKNKTYIALPLAKSRKLVKKQKTRRLIHLCEKSSDWLLDRWCIPVIVWKPLFNIVMRVWKWLEQGVLL